MPASGIDFYIQDARNNFDAVRPAPIPTDDNVVMGQCQNIHISTNCYYGYHDPKNLGNNTISNDCEMLEVADKTGQHATARKRSADNADFPQSKRLRQDVITSNKLMNSCIHKKHVIVMRHVPGTRHVIEKKYKEKILNLRQTRVWMWKRMKNYWSHYIGTLMVVAYFN